MPEQPPNQDPFTTTPDVSGGGGVEFTGDGDHGAVRHAGAAAVPGETAGVGHLTHLGRMAGAVVVVTGASSGIGLATTRALVELGADVVMVARRADLLTELARQLNANGAGGQAADGAQGGQAADGAQGGQAADGAAQGGHAAGGATGEQAGSATATPAEGNETDGRAGRHAAAIRRGRALAVAEDLADPQAPARVVEAALEHFGRLDAVVNNAAVVRHWPLEQWDVAEFDRHLAVNVRAPFLLTQQALPALKASPWGSVVNVSSSSGALRLKGQSVYGMTKAALDYLTGSLAGELASTGVRINAVAPGPIDTPIHATWADDLDEAYRWLAEQVPLGRIGRTEDVVAAVVYLLGPMASFVTGVVLPVDGGQVIRP